MKDIKNLPDGSLTKEEVSALLDMLEELRTFARHSESCAYTKSLDDSCTCGFDGILERYEAWLESDDK